MGMGLVSKIVKLGIAKKVYDEARKPQNQARIKEAVAKVQARRGRAACESDGRGVEASITDKGMAALESAAPTHVAGVRQFLVDLAGDEDFAAVGRVFNAVTDKLIDTNPAADIR